jgi:site-specific DNA recombinase
LEIVRDERVSAKSLKRPGLERLLALVDAGEVDVAIVYKLDRLTRPVVTSISS